MGDLRLVSTTLTGDSQDLIGAALESVVTFVDVCVVINTGVRDDTLKIARAIAKDKYVERKLAWADDFSGARNFALDAALATGGTWAIHVDTDERIEPRGEDLRAALTHAPESVECFLMPADDGSYVKERIIRLPAKSRFSGPTHEAYPTGAGAVVLERARFREVPKTPAQYRKKFERDVRLLARHAEENPTDPRWFYYLGDSLQNLKRFEDAMVAFKECADLRGWNEESAWACYRAAECAIALGRFHRAVDLCAAGLARHAGIAELAWLASSASHKAGLAHQAVWWARLSIAMGLFRGRGADVKRIGFRNVFALYEGPYDVLRTALGELGDETGAKEAETLFEEAKRARRDEAIRR